VNLEKIGKFITECRKKQNLTQKQLAEKLKITDKAVSKWECGNGLPDVLIMTDLCNILKINIIDLLVGEKTNTKYYVRRTEGSMIKKITVNNVLKGIKNTDGLSNVVISKIKDITKRTNNVVFEVEVIGFDVLETEKFTTLTLEVVDETGEMTATLIDTGNDEIKSLIKKLELNQCYRMKGILTLNEEVRGDKLLLITAIKKCTKNVVFK